MKKCFTDIQKIMLAVPFCKDSIFASVKETWPIYINHIFNCALVSLGILLQLQFQHNFDYNSWSKANIATSHAMCQMWGDFARYPSSGKVSFISKRMALPPSRPLHKKKIKTMEMDDFSSGMETPHLLHPRSSSPGNPWNLKTTGDCFTSFFCFVLKM